MSSVSVQVQRSRQLMSPSPVGCVESKMLPLNLQMVPQPVPAVKQSPKPAQNILSSPAGERTSRQRYAQILPKPSATTAITLRSPSTMIIANSSIKTVMTTCHVSPVSLVKMAAISLTPNSSESNTSLTNSLPQPATSSAAAGDISSNQNHFLASVAKPGQTIDTQSMDVEMEVEAIHNNSQMQNPCSQTLSQGLMGNRIGGALQRAASVPIPQTRGFLGLGETSSAKCSGKSSSSTGSVVESINSSSNDQSTFYLNASNQNTNTVSLLNTSRLSSFGESCQAREDFFSTKSIRKRSGLSPELSPVKRVFMPQQPVEGTAGLGYDIRNAVGNVSRPVAVARPESAPATGEVEMKKSCATSTQIHAQCFSSLRACGIDSVGKTDNSMQMKNTSAVMETGTSSSHAVIQEQQGHTATNVHAIPSNPGFQKHTAVKSDLTTGSLHRALQTYGQSSAAIDNLQFLDHSSSSQIPTNDHMDYFPLDDDVTQDSIMEELVQMEEHMKLKHLQEYGNCATLQSQHAAMPGNVASTNQAMAAFFYAPNNRGNPIQTPTPTSEMMGGTQSLTGESPCSHINSTTPVDSALGSSRHTPVGTPHSNCSSTVPPSPVECRNPFAFTPINSNITGFHDSSTVSSSPVKPMQRPMATHPDKARLEWMNNSYNSSGSCPNKSSNGMGIISSYQGLIDDHFQKPHAFAVPHALHHDRHFGRLTPISPVQQQVASMTKQEGFAVPAPLDNKTTNAAAATFRCRSVSPAVHQRNLSVNAGNNSLSNVSRSVVSPFNSPVTPEVLNIFANSKTNLGATSMAQRSRSVPLNIMMQTEALPTQGLQCSNKNITSVLLSKMDGDHNDSVRGLGINSIPSNYTARMNLTQILESNPTENRLSVMHSDSTSTCNSQRPSYLIENAVNEQMILSTGNSQVQSTSGEHQQQAQCTNLALVSQHQEELQQQQHLDFSNTQHLLTDSSLTAGSQLMEQVSELTPGGTDFPCEIRMTPELSSSISDLNSLDTSLLFDPNHQQIQYQSAAPEELVNDPLFQHMSETPHSGGFDWLESKDHPTVGLMG